MEIEEFIKNVDIAFSNMSVCEYEVCDKAMNLYQKYPCYKDWKPEEFKNSVFAYYYWANNRKEVVKEKSKYKDARLLFSTDETIALTGDILTSIHRPFTKAIMVGDELYGCTPVQHLGDWQLEKEKIRRMDGKGISDMLKKPNTPFIGSNYRYWRAFAKVYYWCGNMMPVICNWRGNRDEAIYKVRILHNEPFEDMEVEANYYEDMIKGKTDGQRAKPAKLLPSWRCNQWKEWKDFVKAYYFTDFVDDSQNQKPREDIPLYSLDNTEEWLLKNTKLIIQRSYRIKQNFLGKWSESKYDRESIKEVFAKVFNDSGFTEQEYQQFEPI